MDELEKIKNKRKIYTSLLVTILCIIGVSFAIFNNFARQSANNNVTALNCFSTTLTDINRAISLTEEFPINDENGLKKTPYTFKLTNNCDNYVRVYITIDALNEGETNYILSKYIKGNVSSKGTTSGASKLVGIQETKTLDNNHKGYILLDDGIKAKESKEYDLRLWIDYDTTKEQAAGKLYNAKVVVVTEPGEYIPTLSEAILANNEVKTPLTTPGVEINAYTMDDVTTAETYSVTGYLQSYYVTYGTGWEANGTKFNLTDAAVTTGTYANSYSSLVGKYLPYHSVLSSGSSTAGEMKATTNLNYVAYVVSANFNGYSFKRLSSNKKITEALLATTEDDYGTSYYFRGDVKNNYVEFANKCWRIVRIGGDNTVKLILHNDNTSGVSNPCSSTNNEENAAFAHFKIDGYDEIITYGSFNPSTKDNAYVGFMYGMVGASSYEETHANINKSDVLITLEKWYNNHLKSYDNLIDDNVFCNDKSISGDGLGYGSNSTYYGSYERIKTNKSPSLKCNGELSKITSKIGLITIDEIVYAGYANDPPYYPKSYLMENSEGACWWSLSPYYGRHGSNTAVWGVDGGSGLLFSYDVTSGGSIRPYISLVSSVRVSSGSGTSEDPYKVSI